MSAKKDGILKITKLEFVAGQTSDSKDNLITKPSTITILVGPNNSGKSQCISEIHNWLRGMPCDFKVLKDIELRYPSGAEQLVALISQFQVEPRDDGERSRQAKGELILSKPDIVRNNPERVFVNPKTLGHWLDPQNTPSKRMDLHSHSIKLLSLKLDAETRLNLIKERPAGPPSEDPKNHLWYLFYNRDACKDVSDQCQKAFPAYHFTIDPTKLTHFQIRMNKVEPIPDVEDGYGEPTRKYHSEGQLITEMGDGMKSFVGLIAAVVALKQKYLLIDDPEAFLHPPVARQLGSSLVELATKYETQIIVSSHSGEFLHGCLDTSKAASCTIIRLTYDGEGGATATKLGFDTLMKFMREPILRSTRVLDGLFHAAAIVTEGDSDRVIYEEINRRLLKYTDEGVKDGIFLRAQHRDTIYKLIKPLRDVGVPTAAIVDIDVLCDPPDITKKAYPIKRLVESVEMSANESSAILEKADKVRKFVDQGLTRKSFQKKGIEHPDLTLDVKSILQELIDILETHGIFVVPGGTLESWLKHLDLQGESSAWVVDCLEKLGPDPIDKSDPAWPKYVFPESGDIWDFIRKIAIWIQ
jgi:hypothetical protein